MSLAKDLAEVWDEAEARRGRRWACPELDAPATALVVVGLTRGLLQEAPHAQGALARIEALAAALRLVGGKALWARPDDSSVPPGLALAQGAARATAAQDEFAPGIPRRPGDFVVRARPPSLFFPGASLAPHLLRDAGISTLIFAGGLTHLEVESSLRDAVCAGFQCVVAADCCLDRTPEAHLASLRAMHRSFADVRPTHDLVTLLRRNIGLSLHEVDDVNEAAASAVAASASALPFAPALGTPEPRSPDPMSPEPGASERVGARIAAAWAKAPPPEPPPPAPAREARREAPPQQEPEDSAEEPSMEAILAEILESEEFRRVSGARAPERAPPPELHPEPRPAEARPARRAPEPPGRAFGPQAGAMDEAAARAYIPLENFLASEPDPSKP
ncbi:cysteine hydrolase [Neomegalonema sp.]|uniref:cysteine hydrolase family protein n=1 Tax=Neomegalonema sp. TaxID=2039713 RepID=UPI002618F13A|nr:cysteine hydrolase [Neomegalonema sp.]MDD2867040.1 cysteine hydrolase [Neomegalonema sp.]